MSKSREQIPNKFINYTVILYNIIKVPEIVIGVFAIKINTNPFAQ